MRKFPAGSGHRGCRLEFSGGPLVLAYHWDDAGQVTSRTWNGETQFYGYDPAGEFIAVNVAEGGEGLHPISNLGQSSPKMRLIESYKYDAAGNMIQKTEGDRAATMTYNAANEIVSCAPPRLQLRGRVCLLPAFPKPRS